MSKIDLDLYEEWQDELEEHSQPQVKQIKMTRVPKPDTKPTRQEREMRLVSRGKGWDAGEGL